jgi:hypothetical protein
MQHARPPLRVKKAINYTTEAIVYRSPAVPITCCYTTGAGRAGTGILAASLPCRRADACLS